MMSEQLVERVVIRGIMVYRWYEKSRMAVDAYIDLVEKDIREHVESSTDERPIFYILDISHSGMFPVNYVRERVNGLVKTMRYWPESYIAYVTDNPGDSILVNLIDAMTRRELEHTRKVYKAEDLEMAVDWLISVKNP